MLFVLEQIGQITVEPADITGTGPDPVHNEQCSLGVILPGECTVDCLHRFFRHAAAI